MLYNFELSRLKFSRTYDYHLDEKQKDIHHERWDSIWYNEPFIQLESVEQLSYYLNMNMLREYSRFYEQDCISTIVYRGTKDYCSIVYYPNKKSGLWEGVYGKYHFQSNSLRQVIEDVQIYMPADKYFDIEK